MVDAPMGGQSLEGSDAGLSLAVLVEPTNHEREMAHGNTQVRIQIPTKLCGNQHAAMFDAEMHRRIDSTQRLGQSQCRFDSIWMDIR